MYTPSPGIGDMSGLPVQVVAIELPATATLKSWPDLTSRASDAIWSSAGDASLDSVRPSGDHEKKPRERSTEKSAVNAALSP